MYFENGTIQFKVKSEDGALDENGNPKRPTEETFSEPIPCHIQINKRNNLGKQNGNTFIIASYVIYIETQLYELLKIRMPSKKAYIVYSENLPFEEGRIKLNQRGKDLGEFSVLLTEYLETFEAVKIVV